MSVRDAHDGAGKHGMDERRGASPGGERRGGVGQRVHFEALVAMGEAAGGGGFEAESVDVSPEGMRLRTAYLPQVGDKLLCRFDGMGTEVTAEGEVIWCREEARGGEFGLRFDGYDEQAAEALRGMCAALAMQRGEGPAAGSTAMRGTRVRLHIDGLAAPMKARVREAAGGEIQVGSNLEFLRVGRALEVEDVDHGAKRHAMIDHVKVEVDPATRVPQLVVALRVEGIAKPQSPKVQSAARIEVSKADVAAGAIARAGTLPYGVRVPGAGEAVESAPVREGEPARAAGPAASDAAQEAHFPTTTADLSHACQPAPDVAVQSAASEDAEDEPDDDEDRPARGEEALRNARDKAMAAGTRVAAVVGPALSGMGSRAKGAVSGLLATIRARHAARAEAQPGAPRRTTAPPPSGVLKADGRRLVRDRDDASQGAAEPPESVVPLRSKRKAALLGSVLGLLAILSLFAGYRIFGSMSNAAAPAAPEAAAPVVAAPAVQEVPAGTASGVPTAAVPLFGATPLSTTEPVPPPPAADPAAAPAPGAMAQEDGDGDDDDADENAQGAAKPGQKEWGQGSIRNPVVLKLKMDGEITSLNGAAGAMGFTVSLPGRHSLSTSATELARKDKRIASIQVVNNQSGAEVSVQFKNGVPAYLARAKGSRLEIVLGSEGRKKVAKATSDKSSKKKPDSSKKKPEASAKSKATTDKAKAKKPSND